MNSTSFSYGLHYITAINRSDFIKRLFLIPFVYDNGLKDDVLSSWPFHS